MKKVMVAILLLAACASRAAVMTDEVVELTSGAGVTVDGVAMKDGTITASGTVTANSFVGDGSHLTGISGSGSVTSTAWDGSNWTETDTAPSQSALQTLLRKAAIRAIDVHTASYSIQSGDEGKTFSNYGATGAVQFTLPAESAGLYYRFAQVAPIFDSASFEDSITAAYVFNNGAIVTDSYASGYTLTNNNAVTSTASGKNGYGADFEKGSTQYLSYATSYPPLERPSYSVAMWVNHESVDAAIDYFFKDDATNGYNGYLYRNSGNLIFDLYDGSNTPRIQYSWTPSTGTWYHLVATVEARERIRLYVDGALVGSANDTSTTGSRTLAGAFSLGYRESTNYFDGIMDEVYIFSRALTAAEVAVLYASGTGKFASTTPIKIEPDGTDRIIGLTSAAGDSATLYGASVVDLIGTGNGWLATFSGVKPVDTN